MKTPALQLCEVFFQAEDGIRDLIVTGVQMCALSFQAEDGIRDLIVTGVQISYAVFCLRSEEHTSELQSRSDLVCRLLLEKKKKKTHKAIHELNKIQRKHKMHRSDIRHSEHESV